VEEGEKTIIVEGWTLKDEGDRLNLKGSLKLNFSSGRRQRRLVGAMFYGVLDYA
jgi:hypothetical protein